MTYMHRMHFMFYMHGMHVLYPHMHYMHGGIYKRVKKDGKRVRGIEESNKLCTNQEINKEKIRYPFDVSCLPNLK